MEAKENYQDHQPAFGARFWKNYPVEERST
jgi:hypothetical protein